jgi:uncharacterized protein YybS (DUF2232 family)
VGRGLLTWFLCLTALMAGYAAAQFNPLVYLVVGVLAPLPVLVAGWRAGELAAVALALAMVLAMFTLHPVPATYWANLGFLNLLLMGVLLTSLQAREVEAPLAIIITVVVLSVLAGLVFLGQAFYLGIAPHELLAKKSAEVMTTVHKVLGDNGGAAALTLPGVAPDEVPALLQRLLPGLLVINTAMVAWLNVVLARQIAYIASKERPEPAMYNWAPPEWVIFVLLGAGFLLLVPLPGARLLGLNLLIVLGVLYFSQGLAVVAAWFLRLGLPRPLRVVGYILLFLNPLFILIIALGLVDLWLDFRRLHRPKDA